MSSNISSELENKIKKNIEEFKQPAELLKKYSIYPEVEIEARIIRDDINLEFYKNVLEFMNKSGSNIKLEKEIKSLDINVTSTNDRVNLSSELSNLRFTIEGSSISEYCRTDKLPNDYTLIYKAPIKWNKEQNKSYIDLHDIRINGKIEIEYDKKDEKFKLSSSKIDDEMKDILKTANEKLENYKRYNFSSLYKTYRLKHRHRYRYSFNQEENKPDDFYIDITKIKSSKKRLYGINNEYEMVPVINFIDSEIAEQNEEYQIEFEIIKTSEKGTELTISKYLFPFINRKLLPYVLKSPMDYVYTKEEEYLVRDKYVDQLNTAFNSIILYKVDIIDLLLKNLSNIDTIYKIKGKVDKTIEVDIQRELNEIYKRYGYTHYLENEEVNRYSYYNQLINNLRKNIGERRDEYKNKLENYKSRYNTKLLDSIFTKDSKYMFISPKVMTMEMDNIRHDNLNSIEYGYTITDKADGLGMILFCMKTDELWMNRINLMDSNLKIYPTDIKIVGQEGLYVLNGEYITNLDKKIYGIFDTYIYDGQLVINAPLMISDDNSDGISRISKAYEFLNNIEKMRNDFDIFVKEFKLAKDEYSIWNAGKEIWNKYKIGNGYSYYLDGMIYTPAYEPVGYEDSQIDYDFKLSNTWMRNLKWKPSHDNTIDFLLRFEKVEKARYNGRVLKQDLVVKMPEIVEGGQQIIKNYKIGNIYNGNSISNNSPLKPILFNPRAPVINGAHKIYIELEYDERTKREEIHSIDGSIVEDDTIVELIYDMNNSLDYRKNWKILRTRYDKTYMYKKGRESQDKLYELLQLCLKAEKYDNNEIQMGIQKIMKYIYIKDVYRVRGDIIGTFKKNKKYIQETYKSAEDIGVLINYGNTMSVADSIWTTIHNPITEENILEGRNIPELSVDDDVYYNEEDKEDRESSVTIGLQKFHNYIKSHILIGNAITYCKDVMGYCYLLDMTCGKAGDLNKWVQYKADRCLGLDLYESNIETARDSAVNRYEKYKGSGRGLIPMDFLVGDTSKRYKTNIEEAIKDEKYRQRYNELMKDYYNEKKFNVVSFMFSIHYFFRDMNTLDTLLNNINDHISEGGILIGCCFDGNRILKELIEYKDLIIYKDGKLVMKIVPEFYKRHKKDKWISKRELPNNEESVGLDIDVYMYTIDKLIKEYLVSMEYLKMRLGQYNIYPLTREEMDSMKLPGESMKESMGSFELVYDYIKKRIEEGDKIGNEDIILERLSEDEYNISKLNTYFMFIKRTTKVDKDELEDIIKKYDKYVKSFNKYDKLLDMNKMLSALKKLIKMVKKDIDKDSYEVREYKNDNIVPKIRELTDIYEKYVIDEKEYKKYKGEYEKIKGDSKREEEYRKKYIGIENRFMEEYLSR